MGAENRGARARPQTAKVFTFVTFCAEGGAELISPRQDGRHQPDVRPVYWMKRAKETVTPPLYRV